MSFALYMGVSIGVYFFCMFMAGACKIEYTPSTFGGSILIGLCWPMCVIAACIIFAIVVVFYFPYWLGTKLETKL